MKKIIFSIFFAGSTVSTFSQVEIINEDFQSGIPTNWTIVNHDSNTPVDAAYTNAWIATTDPANSLDTVASSTSYFNPIGTANRWLITPPLSLGAFGNFVSWKAKSHDASYPDDYLVLVSTTDNQIASFQDTIGYVQQENFEWTFRKVNLTEQGYLSPNIYIAFVDVAYDGYRLYMDSIIVTKEDPVSVQELNQTQFEIFPNPVSSHLTIKSQFPITAVRVYSTTGQLLLEEKTSGINVSNLTEGVYYIEVTSNGFTTTKQFIKER